DYFCSSFGGHKRLF
nr:immunoglobulin light chain junction region [Macaca mulatta]